MDNPDSPIAFVRALRRCCRTLAYVPYGRRVKPRLDSLAVLNSALDGGHWVKEVICWQAEVVVDCSIRLRRLSRRSQGLSYWRRP